MFIILLCVFRFKLFDAHWNSASRIMNNWFIVKLRSRRKRGIHVFMCHLNLWGLMIYSEWPRRMIVCGVWIVKLPLPQQWHNTAPPSQNFVKMQYQVSCKELASSSSELWTQNSRDFSLHSLELDTKTRRSLFGLRSTRTYLQWLNWIVLLFTGKNTFIFSNIHILLHTKSCLTSNIITTKSPNN